MPKPIYSINTCILLGPITPRGVEVRTLESGAAIAAFSLEVTEVGKTGDLWRTFIPVEVVGKQAASAGELAPGTWVFVDGWMRWRPQGEQGKGGTLIVQCFDVRPMTRAGKTPPAAPAASKEVTTLKTQE